jgi:pyridoxamine 5'-phosphate oxidase
VSGPPDPAAFRREYETAGLDAGDLDPDPIAQFGAWYAQAREAGLVEPEAMVLSTVDDDGGADARYVLLRGVDARGFAFYTNFESAKARQMAASARVALTFGWLALHRQVRVIGRVELLPDEESDAYFAARPRASRLGAWASPQSRPLTDRAELDSLVATSEERFAGTEDVARPEFWGGYLVRPSAIEFWQGRANRLHDRLRYRRPDDGGAWLVERLAP